jgi:23S rRNA pseudouridine1911/1915/1917 synthase
VLSFDFRGQGESDGEIDSFGDRERRDVLGAVRWVRENHAQEARRIVAVGVDTGGAALLAAAADPSSEGRALDALAVFGCYDRFSSLATSAMRYSFSPALQYPFVPVALGLVSVQTGCDLCDFSPARAAEAVAPRPILFVHCRDDPVVSFESGQNLFDAASAPKSYLWLDRRTAETDEQAADDSAVANLVRRFLDTASEMLWRSGIEMRLLDRLREEFPTAKQATLRRMVREGRVQVNGKKAARTDLNVGKEDRVVVGAGKKFLPRLPFDVLYEDRDVIVIDKPAGMLTSTNARERRPTAFAAVRQYVQEREPGARVGLVHRLDRDASGLLVFAKNSRALSSLKGQFARHSVTRVYHAIVSPAPRDGRRIESFLVERADGSVHSTNVPGRGQKAITRFSVAKCRGEFALLRVELETGRKHQIRAQLSEAGFGVVGDEMYGEKVCDKGLMLEAVELGFEHPKTGRSIFLKLPKGRVEGSCGEFWGNAAI